MTLLRREPAQLPQLGQVRRFHPFRCQLDKRQNIVPADLIDLGLSPALLGLHGLELTQLLLDFGRQISGNRIWSTSQRSHQMQIQSFSLFVRQLSRQELFHEFPVAQSYRSRKTFELSIQLIERDLFGCRIFDVRSLRISLLLDSPCLSFVRGDLGGSRPGGQNRRRPTVNDGFSDSRQPLGLDLLFGSRGVSRRVLDG